MKNQRRVRAQQAAPLRIKFWIMLGMLLWLGVACSNDPKPRLDVTLEPSQLAVNSVPTATPTATQPTPEAVVLSRGSAAPLAAPTEAASIVVSTPEPTIAAATPLPASNAAELQALVQNPNLVLLAEMDTQCFLAGDFIPFRLVIRSLETAPIYFYTKGKWQLSINNSPVGPQLEPLLPSLRDDFAEIQPGEAYTRNEEDLGLWTQSLGEIPGVAPSVTGIGLSAGDYWVSFIYSNDQDGLTQQPDESYLIDRPAWQGTVVAPELRFKVVNDLTQC